jgi:hypothetical protein
MTTHSPISSSWLGFAAASIGEGEPNLWVTLSIRNEEKRKTPFYYNWMINNIGTACSLRDSSEPILDSPKASSKILSNLFRTHCREAVAAVLSQEMSEAERSI